MLNAYLLTPGGPLPVENPSPPLRPAVGWVDLLNPVSEEDKATEQWLGASIPTREEAQEIEFSSRFYVEGGAQYLTISVLTGIEAGQPLLTPLSFVLVNNRLATVRYADFSAFRQFLVRSAKADGGCSDAAGILLTLIEAIIDRNADVVERTGAEIDRLNADIFGSAHAQPKARRKRERRLETFLGKIGFQNDIVSKTRESLTSLERMLQYVTAAGIDSLGRKSDGGGRLKLAGRDVRSLTDQLSFLSTRATFLLDATLGLVSLQQNDVIRLFTIAATILLPPTVIGTVYGMNFTHMPELDWAFGYPFAIGLMIASAVIPFLLLRRWGWV